MFGLFRNRFTNLSPSQIEAGLKAGTMLLIDVREPDEYRAERIKGAVSLPLSRFTPAGLPKADGRTVVLHCAGGVRSQRALGMCADAGVDVTHHMAGGLNAWKACGLPTLR